MATISASNTVGYWLGIVSGKDYAEGQHGFVVGSGIGERVFPTNTAPKEGTKEAAIRSANWFKSMAKIDVAADALKINFVTIAPRWEYESNEFPLAAKHAREVLKCGKLTVLNNSLGEYGFSKESGKNPELPKMFDNLISFVAGPGMTTNTAKNIAAAKLPCLFITCENDIASGTSPQATISLHKSILDAGGVSWLICLKAGQYTDKNAHQIISVIAPMLYDGKGKKLGDVGAVATDTPLGEKGIKNVITKMTMSIYEWAERNSRTQSVAPDAVISEVPPKEEPIPVPIPVPDPPKEEPPVVVDPIPSNPPANKIGIKYVLQNSNTIKKSDGSFVNNTNVTVFWADESEQKIEIPSGYRNAGTWEDKDRGIYTMDVIGIDNPEDKKPIIFGPYKKTQ